MPCARSPSSSRPPPGFRDGSGGWRIKPSPHARRRSAAADDDRRFMFPLFYGQAGDGYIVIASKGGAPQHPGWYRNILADPDVEVQVGTKKMNARARTTAGGGRPPPC